VKVRHFSLREYLARALELAEYERAEDGVVIARVPDTAGFYAQGTSVEEARSALAEVIEGNLLLALQLGFDIPKLPGVGLSEQDVA
jgi:predicted RNase H-like HicB family nuclease